MTLQELYDFALEHECGELTPVVFDIAGAALWCGSITAGERLFLSTSATNQFKNLSALLFAAQTNTGLELVVQHGAQSVAVSSIARGQTPDGFAQALVLQVA